VAVVAPPSCVQALLGELASARWTVQKWQHGGRYGVAVTVVDLELGDREAGRDAPRAIPITEAAATAIASGSDSLGSCPLLASLLKDGRAEVRAVAASSASRRPQQMKHTDHAVHPERSTGVVYYHQLHRLLHSDAPPASVTQPIAGGFTFLELFAGIGGFRVGLEALGGRCVFASELDPEAVQVYCRQFGADHMRAGDICAVPDSDIPPHDMLTGGFPCQPFSSLGLQPGLDDARGTLFMQIVRVLRLRNPRTFLLENVPGLLKCDGGRAFNTIVSALRGCGYYVWWELVNSRCLTAQARNRVYLVGLRRQEGIQGPEARSLKRSQSDLEPQPAETIHVSPPCIETKQPAFMFPYIPDLRLRIADIISPEAEEAWDTGAARAGSSSADSSVCVLSDRQWERFQESKTWRRRGPGGLAWGDLVADAIISHYGQDVGGGGSQLVPCLPPRNPRCFEVRETARLQGFPSYFVLDEMPGVSEGSGDAAGSRWVGAKSLYRMVSLQHSL
jgi:DNA (cytosine-5)-methyltransferase 1